MNGSPYDLKVDRYKHKETFPKADRFETVEPAKQAKFSVMKQPDTPKSGSTHNGVPLEKISLAQMKAQFARELKLMIENEVRID